MPNAVCRRKRAFTLIEILAVLAIMTVIAGLLVAAAVGARRKADNDAAQADVTFISAQIEAYYNKRGQLPPNLNPLSPVPQPGEDDITTEFEIYQTLAEWNLPVPPERRVDPWGNPYVIVFQRDYGKVFPLESGGNPIQVNDEKIFPYNITPFNRMQIMYNPPLAPVPPPVDVAKEIHRGDPAATASFNDSMDNFQVISAGPDGYIVRDGLSDYNADNFVNW